jgi:hypothetical protein
MTLKTLIPRIEQAGADEQREMLEAVWNTIHPPKTTVFVCMTSGEPIMFGNPMEAPSFVRKLDAEAYLDAAMMLVPSGYDWAVFRTNGGLTIHAWCGDRTDIFAETEAMALLAAICRAHVKEGEDGR